ncbi:hypothetical protein MSNKSG1_17426 [Marinobacter santoriniensis NKSG1]|uniref:DUF2489 domain-containing protein n=1 Tax=Marinobacter santoriniensis NKSG1 TaxID=1288826 RepID=M7CLW4_9GAMM|nr:DUF2489 domain-containing protein [Marinobacter santoriniensis]EMP54189.1 hypothetical protein MSNKSG1_17426 [Marinobacter santoriniensis NKSG1]
MPPWLQWTLIIAGLATIGCLVLFIRKQLNTINLHRRREEKASEFRLKRRQDMIDSIRVIALAVEEDQIEYSEACLRLKGLLDHVAPDLLDQSPFRVFQTVHEKLQHMPTHRARQATDSRFIEKLDKERFDVERAHTDEIRRAATAIRHHRFEGTD